MSTPDRRRDAPTLDLWRRNFATDPHFDGPGSPETTKEITGKTYRGTSLDPVYVVQRLTHEFGPIGDGWGIECVHERFLEGEPYMDAKGTVIARELMHLGRFRMWWRRPGQETQNSFEICGGTQAFYRSSKGRWISDEDVWKKTETDALTKGASRLGIGADIHAGMWDSSKYVEERVQVERTSEAKSRAMEKIAVIEHTLAQCEDAGAVRAYVGQDQFKKWLGVQDRNHPEIHSRVLELIAMAKARFSDGVPEEEPEQEPSPPPLYCYASSSDGLLEWPNLDRWRHEWAVRIASVLRSQKPAKARYEKLEGMLERNRAIVRDLHEVDDAHASAVQSVTGRITHAQTLLRQLDADSLEPVSFDDGGGQ